jgi:hypothetical protein
MCIGIALLEKGRNHKIIAVIIEIVILTER